MLNILGVDVGGTFVRMGTLRDGKVENLVKRSSAEIFSAPGGAAAGLAAGLFWDLYATHIYGFNGLVMMIIGCVAGLLIWLLLRNTWLTAWLLSAAAVLAQVLADWLFCYLIAGRDGPGWVLFHLYLPNALYTALLSPLFYFLTRSVIRTLRRRI